MKRVFCVVIGCLLALTFITACSGGGQSKETEHTHTFDTGWLSDENDHWHPATCDHTDEVSEKGNHVDEDKNDVCDVCGYRQKHTHTYASEWTQGEKTHYHKNTCGHDDLEKYRKDETPHADANNDGLCDVCAYDYGHTHTYAEEWTPADGGHWHAPTCGHDVPGSGLTDHADVDNDGLCDVCGYDYGHTHTYDEAWDADESNHWHNVTCWHTIPVKDLNAHVDTDADGVCDVCGYKPEHFHTFDTAWSSDPNTHFHLATCGHDAKSDIQPHDGFREDGICDTCAYVVFRFYTVTVSLPDDSLSVTAPDGTAATSFSVKEGTDAAFQVILPTRFLLVKAEGATIEGKPVKDGLNHIYTLKVSAVNADRTVGLTIDKTSNVEVIIANGEQEMEIVKAWTYVNGTMTVNLPSSGHYIIYSNSHPGLMGVTFSLDGNTVVQDETSIAYDFEVTEAGEVTLNYAYFPWEKPESGKETFTYVVAKIDPTKTLEVLAGEGYTMPTNATVQITFTVPEPGLYQINSSYPVQWDGDVTAPHIFAVEAGQLTQTMTMQYNTSSAATFPFDWTIEKLGAANPVGIGETPVTAPLREYTCISFTADRDGSYYFSLSDAGMMLYQWYVSDYGNSMNQIGNSWTAGNLKAGDTVTLYIRADAYNTDITEDIAGTLSVTYMPVKTDDGYLAQAGVQNTFISDEYQDFEYAITLPNGGQISFDGGQTWVSGAESMLISAYGSLNYMVQNNGASEVLVSFEMITYEYNLSVGENTVTMIPGHDYTVTLSGTASDNYYVSYFLSWTEASLTVSYMGQNLTSGSEVAQYAASSGSLTITYGGASTAEIHFTVQDGYVPPKSDLVLGDNALDIQKGLFGETFLFVAPEAGTYVFSYAADEKNGYAMDSNTSEELKFPYEVTLRKNETFTLLMGTADSTVSNKSDIINIVITKKN